jgi:hypothetical protein
MIDNLNVSINIEKNPQDELEVNGLNRRALINGASIGKITL